MAARKGEIKENTQNAFGSIVVSGPCRAAPMNMLELIPLPVLERALRIAEKRESELKEGELAKAKFAIKALKRLRVLRKKEIDVIEEEIHQLRLLCTMLADADQPKLNNALAERTEDLSKFKSGLLEIHLDMHIRSIDGKQIFRSALYLAVRRGNTPLVNLLIAAKANVNARNKTTTPLIMACERNYNDIVKQLVAANAFLNDQDENGNTALMHACDEGNLENALTLVSAGADFEISNKKGQRAIDCANQRGEVLNWIVCMGAIIYKPNQVILGFFSFCKNEFYYLNLIIAVVEQQKSLHKVTEATDVERLGKEDLDVLEKDISTYIDSVAKKQSHLLEPLLIGRAHMGRAVDGIPDSAITHIQHYAYEPGGIYSNPIDAMFFGRDAGVVPDDKQKQTRPIKTIRGAKIVLE